MYNQHFFATLQRVSLLWSDTAYPVPPSQVPSVYMCEKQTDIIHLCICQAWPNVGQKNRR